MQKEDGRYGKIQDYRCILGFLIQSLVSSEEQFTLRVCGSEIQQLHQESPNVFIKM